MVPKGEYTTLELAGHEVRLSNPSKVYFPKPGWTKLDIAHYYAELADAVLVHLPRNDAIKASTDPDLATVRARFDEAAWARWNVVRALASTAALVCLAWGLAEYSP